MDCSHLSNFGVGVAKINVARPVVVAALHFILRSQAACRAVFGARNTPTCVLTRKAADLLAVKSRSLASELSPLNASHPFCKFNA